MSVPLLPAAVGRPCSGWVGLEPPLGAADAAAALRGLPVSPEGGGTYRRDDCGERWPDLAGTGCNERDLVLARDAVPGTVRTGRQGSWHGRGW